MRGFKGYSYSGGQFGVSASVLLMVDLIATSSSDPDSSVSWLFNRMV